MSTEKTIPDIPTTLDELLGFSTSCSCGRIHSVELQFASIGTGVLGDVVDFSRAIRPAGRIAVITDSNVKGVAGDNVQRLLQSAGHQTTLFVLPNGPGARPHADEKTLHHVENALASAELAIAVGSGTINDLTKLGSFRAGIPYITVATAPSMNGYTSAIAAIMVQGVKRTVDCHQPRAVVADLAILSKAPSDLIAAGLGDLESKPTALADYRLGGLLNDTHYCHVPEAVVLAAEERAADEARGLGVKDPSAISALTEALILSGISMKMAGSSSPASGGEHLISHYFDMTAEDENRLEGWHGAQVGVATIVTATLFEHIRDTDPTRIDIDQILSRRPSRAETEAAIRLRHGKRATEVMGEFFQKYRDDEELERFLQRTMGEWNSIWAKLDPILRTGAQVKDILAAGGAPTTMGELGLTPDHLRSAYMAAREIRNRYTVLDFAAEIGQLELLREPVLKASGCL